jgi:hypothetical protein
MFSLQRPVKAEPSLPTLKPRAELRICDYCWVLYTRQFLLERVMVPDVISDVFFVDQHLMHGAAIVQSGGLDHLGSWLHGAFPGDG